MPELQSLQQRKSREMTSLLQLITQRALMVREQ